MTHTKRNIQAQIKQSVPVPVTTPPPQSRRIQSRSKHIVSIGGQLYIPDNVFNISVVIITDSMIELALEIG